MSGLGIKASLRRLMDVNSSRHRLWLENKRFADSIPAGSLVLDAGAGEAPYKSLLAHAVYESADFEKIDKPYAQTTYVCDLKDIPVDDQRYDFVFFNQVMEHLPEPAVVLRELFRVMKPGAKLIYTAPFYFEEHGGPYDYFRYTQYGVRHLFGEAGFACERFGWLEGYFETVGYQMSGMARHLPRRGRDIAPGALGWLLVLPMVGLKIELALGSALFHALEKKTKYTTHGHPKNYVAIMSRPLQA